MCKLVESDEIPADAEFELAVVELSSAQLEELIPAAAATPQPQLQVKAPQKTASKRTMKQRLLVDDSNETGFQLETSPKEVNILLL